MPGLSERQNDARAVQLLRAVRSANRVPTWIDSARGVVSVGFVIASVVVALRGETSAWLAGSGAVWAAVSSLYLKRWGTRRATEAAAVQEAFDRHVYDLPTSSLPVASVLAERIHHLAQRWHGDTGALADWYPVTALTRPYDVLVCQRANAAWDIRLRQRWGSVLTAAITIWLVAGLAIGLLQDLSVGELLLRWYVPSLGATTFGVEAIRSQQHTIGERHALLARLDDALATRHEPLSLPRFRTLLAIAREVQDGLYRTRCETSRVPGWFYRVFRDRDNAAMTAAAEGLDEPND